MRPTLRYIAERANVSIGTVDRVVHNRGRVSPETRTRVQAIVEEIGYSPNIFASNLSTSRIYRFAAIMPREQGQSDHWGLHLRGLLSAKQELARMNVELELIRFDLSDIDTFVHACKVAESLECSGFMLVPPARADIACDWASKWSERAPVVLVDSDLPNLDQVYFRGQNPIESGRVCGRLFSYILPRNAKILIIMPKSEASHLRLRAQGVTEIAGEFCDIIQYPMRTGDDEYTMPRTVEMLLKEHSDARGLVVPNAAIFQLAREFERRSEKFGMQIIGYDAIEENVRLLKAGYIDFLIGTHPDTQSYSALHALYQIVVLKQKLPQRTTQPVEILIRDNIDSYRSTSSTNVVVPSQDMHVAQQ